MCGMRPVDVVPRKHFFNISINSGANNCMEFVKITLVPKGLMFVKRVNSGNVSTGVRSILYISLPLTKTI